MYQINFPLLGNSLIMAIVILVHVFFAFVAVGGIVIAFASEIIAYRKNSAYHDRFAEGYVKFLSEMMKPGGVLGVFIVVLLISLFPEFTKRLYNFFFWPLVLEVAMFFIMMVATIYWKVTWGRIQNRKFHLFVGALAALSAIVSALIINAAHSFMLTPGKYFEEPKLFNAVFNPTMFASSTHLLIPCIANAAAFAFIYALFKSRKAEGENKEYFAWLAKYSGTIFAAAILLQPFSGLSFLLKLRSVNETVFNNIINGSVSKFFYPMVGIGVLAVSCAAVYFISGRKTQKILLLGSLAALTAFSFGGYTRERARKPYLIYGHMYMSEAFAAEPLLSAKVPLESGAAAPKRTVNDALSSRGCLSCHKYKGTGGTFGPALDEHLKHHPKEELKKFLRNPPEVMPPFTGTEEELNKFIEEISP
ncbi:MAG: cytochrome ubiquinol oxidase subunit I [Deltaproteobacteria bacterium]|nr:cytochrome ubiquinol oxidase subunit I [Deltaproteobacteria bacterium]